MRIFKKNGYVTKFFQDFLKHKANDYLASVYVPNFHEIFASATCAGEQIVWVPTNVWLQISIHGDDQCLAGDIRKEALEIADCMGLEPSGSVVRFGYEYTFLKKKEVTQ